MINLYDILEAADGQLFGDAAAILFTDFCYDSRRVNPGELFIAVKTERGDGHNYMREAIQGGAMGIMCQHPPDFDTTGYTVIVMRDVERALLRWAERMLRRYNTTVIGVTGSAGKSTAKEAIAAVLGIRYRVYKSPGSYNGRFGLPLALGKLTAEDKLAVLEFGSDHDGEMAELVEVTRPLVGIVTNVSYGYEDRIGTATNLQHLAREHGQLINSLPKEGLAVLNYDDDLVRSMGENAHCPVLTVGLDRTGSAFGADLTAYNLLIARDKTGFDLRHERERYVGRWVPLLGYHQLYSILSALAIGTAYDISVEDGLRALTDMQPLPGRMNPIEGKGQSLLIDDTFSANAESTLAALDWLNTVKSTMKSANHRQGRLIFILGDMNNLGGGETAAGHRMVGKRASEVVDMFITEGDLAAVAGRAALDQGMERNRVKITFSPQDSANVLADELTQDDLVLIKGSAGARMELVTRQLLARDEDATLLARQESAYDSVWINRPSRPTWVEVDKTAIAQNVRLIKEIVGPEVALMAVVKGNAYGHGSIAVGATAILNGAEYLAVASVNEAIELREGAIDAPVLVLGYTPPWLVRQALRYNLTLNLYDLELARSYDRIAREVGATLKVHVEVDTGMTRLGLLTKDVTPFFRGLKNLKNVEVEGIFTHFSSSEWDIRFTDEQFNAFQAVLKPLKASGFNFRYIHAGNTAAAMNIPKARLNMVRVGLGMYGLCPNPEIQLPEGFRPAMTWKTTVAQVKTVPAGTFVGYNNTYRTRGTERIAIIAVGYADGFRRAPKHWGYVLVNGQQAQIIGRISMDMTAINVTDIHNINVGDEVVLIGRQGKQQITADDVAHALDTSSYEVISTILSRVPRV